MRRRVACAAMNASPVPSCRGTGTHWSMSVGALAITLLVTATSCGAAPAPLAIDMNGRWTTRTVADKEVSLSVPSDWNVGQGWVLAGSFTDLVGSFSNQQLSAPCITSGNSTACGPPLTSLQRGGILVDVYHNGSPNWTISTQPGTPTTVSGMPARVIVQRGSQQACTGLGADWSRTELIAFANAPDNYIEISICSRGVADAVGARVMASVRISPIG